MKKYLVLALITLFFSPKASLAESRESLCNKNASSMASCAKEDLEILDRKLGGLVQKYTSLHKSDDGPEADKEITERMNNAQRSWKEYRDAHCRYEYYTKAAIHAPSVDYAMIRCQVLKTEERIKEVEEYLSNAEL